MLSDLDRTMAARELDWLVAIGSPGASPDVRFLTRGARVGHCTVLKRRGAEPLAIGSPMEREEARASGLPYTTWLDYGSAEISKLGLPPIEQSRRAMLNALEAHGVRGRTAFVGEESIGYVFPLLRGVLAARPSIEVVEELDLSAVVEARVTKSPDEVARIRDVGRRTEEVVAEVVALLRSCRVRGGILTRPDGAPLKIGDVKDRISLELARRRLDDHGETIFAAGREAGFPHSRGTETEPVPAGKTIIFDIFPQEKGGGFCFDFTRTFWVGPVPDRVREVFDAVEAAFHRSVAAIRAGGPARAPDAASCDVFEERGFVTKRQDPKTQIGYCHSVGHGIGLETHERPHMTIREGYDRDVFAPGMVFTIEPGLYYPDEEIGVRIEDTLWLRPDGTVEDLARFPMPPEITLA